MTVTENKTYSKDYMDSTKRSIANKIQIVYLDGSCSDEVEVLYPIGHLRRRKEGVSPTKILK